MNPQNNIRRDCSKGKNLKNSTKLVKRPYQSSPKLNKSKKISKFKRKAKDKENVTIEKPRMINRQDCRWIKQLSSKSKNHLREGPLTTTNYLNNLKLSITRILKLSLTENT